MDVNVIGNVIILGGDKYVVKYIRYIRKMNNIIHADFVNFRIMIDKLTIYVVDTNKLLHIYKPLKIQLELLLFKLSELNHYYCNNCSNVITIKNNEIRYSSVVSINKNNIQLDTCNIRYSDKLYVTGQYNYEIDISKESYETLLNSILS